MIIELLYSIADGPLRPGELEIARAAAPLVSWSVNTGDVSERWDLEGNDLAIELHFPDNTVWTGEAYPVAEQPPEHKFPSKVRLRGIGALSENSVPVHAEVVEKRIEAMLAAQQRGV